MNTRSRLERIEKQAAALPRTLDEIRYIAATLPPERSILVLTPADLERWLLDDLEGATPVEARDILTDLAQALGLDALPDGWVQRWAPELLDAPPD